MIDYGEAALITAFGLCFIPMIGVWVFQWQSPLFNFRLVQFCSLFNWALITIAFIVLLSAFANSNFTLSTVAMNSQASEPLFYRVTAIWGNHEGSLLLWVWILSTYQSVFALSGQAIPVQIRTSCLVLLTLILGSFLALLLWTSNPFERLAFPASRGLGLNPILQDPALAIHPPALYCGYIGFAIPFVLAGVALWEKKWDFEWARWVQPWALFAWSFLTLGITLGSWWAYYELGWGGWWFWDPVENASLFPWFLGIGLIHSLQVVQKKELAQAWALLLAILTFGLCVLGTYVVRSGVLPSVHAFARDSQRGLFILSLLALFMGPSLFLFVWRVKLLPQHLAFPLFSRIGAIAMQNYGMMLLTLALLMGTLYPLLSASFSPFSVSPAYFNMTLIPLSLPFLFLMGLAPIMNWQQGSLLGLLQRSHWQLMTSFLAFIVGFYYMPSAHVLPLSILALGGWIVSTTLLAYIQKIKVIKDHGMYIAHLGLAFSLIGMSVDTLFTKGSMVPLAIGESVQLEGYHFQLKGIELHKTNVYMAEKGVVQVLNNHHTQAILCPEKRFYTAQQLLTNEVALYHHGLSQYYVALGGAQGSGRRILSVYYHPLVSLIWIGGLFMTGGGLLSWFRRFRKG